MRGYIAFFSMSNFKNISCAGITGYIGNKDSIPILIKGLRG